MDAAVAPEAAERSVICAEIPDVAGGDAIDRLADDVSLVAEGGVGVVGGLVIVSPRRLCRPPRQSLHRALEAVEDACRRCRTQRGRPPLLQMRRSSCDPPFGGGLQMNVRQDPGRSRVCSPATVDLRVQAACRPAANGGAATAARRRSSSPRAARGRTGRTADTRPGLPGVRRSNESVSIQRGRPSS